MKLIYLFQIVSTCFTTKKKCYWPEPESFRLADTEGQVCPWAKCNSLLTEMDKQDCLHRNQARKFKKFLKLINFEKLLDKKIYLACKFIRWTSHHCLSIELNHTLSRTCRREHKINTVYAVVMHSFPFVNRTVDDLNCELNILENYFKII